MQRPDRTTSRGSVLVVVLWASIGLVSVALLFGHSMLMNYRGVDNDVAGRQADQAIEGAIRYAKTLLTEVETKGNLPEITAYEGEAVPVGEAQFWFLGRSDGDVNGTTREYALVDEASKLNVNTATADMLLRLPGMTQDLAEAIVTWRTATGSAPNETAKGGPFDSVEELALVPGMTREILYGEDTNLNGVLDANEDDGDRSLPQDNSDGKIDPGLCEYLTAFTREPATQPAGTSTTSGTDGTTSTDPRFNVGDVNPDVINTINAKLDEVIPGHTAVTLVSGNYTSVVDFIVRGGLDALSEDELDKVAGYFVSPRSANDPTQPLLEGLVNLNTASEAVLTALLDDASLAANLVAARAGRVQPSTGIHWAIDLLRNVTSPGLAYLTAQSFQVTADVAAVGRHGRGYRRARVVFDLTGEEPQIIYRRNLAPLGWALGSDTRERLAMTKGLLR